METLDKWSEQQDSRLHAARNWSGDHPGKTIELTVERDPFCEPTKGELLACQQRLMLDTSWFSAERWSAHSQPRTRVDTHFCLSSHPLFVWIESQLQQRQAPGNHSYFELSQRRRGRRLIHKPVSTVGGFDAQLRSVVLYSARFAIGQVSQPIWAIEAKPYRAVGLAISYVDSHDGSRCAISRRESTCTTVVLCVEQSHLLPSIQQAMERDRLKRSDRTCRIGQHREPRYRSTRALEHRYPRIRDEVGHQRRLRSIAGLGCEIAAYPLLGPFRNPKVTSTSNIHHAPNVTADDPQPSVIGSKSECHPHFDAVRLIRLRLIVRSGVRAVRGSVFPPVPFRQKAFSAGRVHRLCRRLTLSLAWPGRRWTRAATFLITVWRFADGRTEAVAF